MDAVVCGDVRPFCVEGEKRSTGCKEGENEKDSEKQDV